MRLRDVEADQGQGFNDVHFKNQINYPLISQIQDNHTIDGKLVAHAVFNNLGGGDIIVS